MYLVVESIFHTKKKRSKRIELRWSVVGHYFGSFISTSVVHKIKNNETDIELDIESNANLKIVTSLRNINYKTNLIVAKKS